MIFGFNIDDVIRGTSERIWEFYTKEKPDSLLNVEDVNFFDPQTYPFQNEEEFTEFFDDYVLEIFGSSKEQYRNVHKDFNSVANYLTESNIESVIIQKEIQSRIKCATLYYISDRLLDINTIHFVSTLDSFWEKCDVVVTTNPNLLEYAVENSFMAIKVERPYNIHINGPSLITIKEVKDIFNLDLKAI